MEDAQVRVEEAQVRRERPVGARCDACHARKAQVRRSRDGLLTICATCARGVDVTLSDVDEAIVTVVGRAPADERRNLSRRLLARQAMHARRRARRGERPGARKTTVASAEPQEVLNGRPRQR
jgi:hypothetical protein